MSLDTIDNTIKTSIVVAPSNSLLGVLRVKFPKYFDIVKHARLEKRYVDGMYTIFIPNYIPDCDRSNAYTFCQSTTVNGSIDPETLHSSELMVIDTLAPARFIGIPQNIKEIIKCSNGWIYSIK